MKKKNLVMPGLIAAVSMLSAFCSFAGEWKQDKDGWWWQEADGSYPANQWKWLDGNADGIYEKYHFDSEGYLDADKLLTDTDGARVKVNADGAKLNGNNEVSFVKNPYEIITDKSDYLFGQWDKHKSVRDNSEYMSEYDDLKQGAVFVYDDIGNIDVDLIYTSYLNDTGGQFAYFSVVADTDTYIEHNFFADEKGQKPTGKISQYNTGDLNGGCAIRIFVYE